MCGRWARLAFPRAREKKAVVVTLAKSCSARAALDLFPIVGRRPEIPIKGAAVSRDTPPHCVLGPRPGRYARRYRLSAPALWHPSRGHPCAARMQTQLNTLRLQSSIFLATSCWNQPGPLCPLMAVMSVAGHWPVPLHMRQPSTSNSQLPLTAPGSHTPPDAVIAFTCVYLLGSQST